MAPPYARPAAGYFLAAHHLRRLYGRGHGTEGGFNVHHHPLPQTRGGAESHAGYFEDSFFIALADYRAYLGRTYIEADY
jgi:hypothetical protein